jgi:toxin-antitoxin system PIN domain toxin
MRIPLLDVNVLVALFDPAHPHHDDAHRWFAHQRKRGWATCAITLNGCARVLSNPSYPTVDATTAEVFARLRVLCDEVGHHFWHESISPLNEAVFHLSALAGPGQLTDVYLLGMAVQHGGKLATFDKSIPLKVVVGATKDHLELLGSNR